MVFLILTAAPPFFGTVDGIKAREPIVIEVETIPPLGNLWQDSLPVILPYGEILPITHAVRQTKLVAFVEDADQPEGRNEIGAVRVGNLEATRSREGVMVLMPAP